MTLTWIVSYSALLIGQIWEDLIVAAGTVFNEVVIWPVKDPNPENGVNRVITRLSGHKVGVVQSALC